MDIHEPFNEVLDEGVPQQTGAERALFNQRLKSSLQLRQLICNGSHQDKPGYKSLRMCYSAWLSGFALAASDT